MKKLKRFISVISLGVILLMTLGTANWGSIRQAFAAGETVGDGQVKITNVKVSKENVQDKETIDISADFQGGKNVKPGTQITIDLPKRTTELAGVYGVNSTFNISGKTFSGEEVPDVATVHVAADKVTVTFNQNVTKLPNGFTGSFTFQAEAQLSKDHTGDQAQTTTITVGGHLIKIHIYPHETGGSGVNPGPSDIPEDTLEKVGYVDRKGDIYWQVNGSVTAKATGDITIADTSADHPASKILPHSFAMIVQKAGNGGTHKYGYTELVNKCHLHVDESTGAWSMKVPADMLKNSNFVVVYRTKPEALSNGQTYHNSASMTVNQKQISKQANVEIKNMGSGNVSGDSGSSSTAVKPSSTSSSSSSSSEETATKPTESSSSSTAVKPSSTSSSSTSSSEETATKPTESSSSSTTKPTTTNSGSTTGGNGGTTTTTTNGPTINNQDNGQGDHQSSDQGWLPQTGAKKLAIFWTCIGVILVIVAIIIAIVKHRDIH